VALKTAFKGLSSVATAPTEDVYSSKTLGKFLSFVFSRSGAELIDLGPVIGSNIAFMGERVGCKIHIEDLYADLDRHALEGTLDRLPDFMARCCAGTSSTISIRTREAHCPGS